MPAVLITGASRGLGLAFARRYAAEGWTVHAACRDPDGAADLARVEGSVSVERLDVALDEGEGSASALARRLAGAPLDLLVNNAGIGEARGEKPGDYAGWRQVLETNTLGPHRVTNALLANLRAGDQRKVVAITSGLGSIGDNRSGGSIAYRASKAALNMVMRTLSVELGRDGFTVAVLSPGWVRTDMGGARAPLDADASVDGMVRVIAGLTPADNGRFLDHQGRELPW